MTIALFIIGIIFFLWLCLLTVFFWTLSAHYNNLVKTTNKRALQAILDTLLVDVNATKKDIEMLKTTCDTITKDSRLYIQKIGLLRFNPFKDTGGDQSFILALVDADDTGIVISGLYSRSGTRWYAKQVEKGTGVEHELSDEEKKAIQEAKRMK